VTHPASRAGLRADGTIHAGNASAKLEQAEPFALRPAPMK
jgi:hypothetical protein